MSKTKAARPRIGLPTKTHGGKFYMAPDIVRRMPRHVHYCEPYFGGGAVLMARDPADESLWAEGITGVSEVVNDIHKDLMTFWRVLADDAEFPRFVRKAQATPFAEAAYADAVALLADRDAGDVLARAVAFFVASRQSLAGRMSGFTGITKTRTRSGMNNEASAWWGAVEGLREVHDRLKRVVIMCRDALAVVRGQDGPGTFFYLDPPYLDETRASPAVYRHEYTPEQHHDLLVTLGGTDAADVVMRRFRAGRKKPVPSWWLTGEKVQGKFLLSGYPSQLYDAVADRCGWTCETIELPNAAAGGTTKRRMTECLWRNYPA